MKTLELKLPTPVLLVWGLPEDACFVTMTYPVNSLYYSENDGSKWVDITKGNWQLIGKLSELTEEQAKELVSKVMNNQHYQNYNYKEAKDRWVKTSLESFDSAIEGAFYKNLRTNKKRLSHHEPAYYAESDFQTIPANTLIFKRV